MIFAVSQKLLDKIALKEAKTKYIAQMLKAMSIENSVLLVVANDDEAVKRACANIANLTLINADLLNVYDLAANAKCIFTKDAVAKIEEVYA